MGVEMRIWNGSGDEVWLGLESGGVIGLWWGGVIGIVIKAGYGNLNEWLEFKWRLGVIH